MARVLLGLLLLILTAVPVWAQATAPAVSLRAWGTNGVLDANGDSFDFNVGQLASAKIQTLDSYSGTWEVQCSLDGTTFDTDDEVFLTLEGSTAAAATSVTDAVGIWTANIAGCRTIRIIATAGFAASDTTIYVQAVSAGGGAGSVSSASTVAISQTADENAVDILTIAAGDTDIGNVDLEIAGTAIAVNAGSASAQTLRVVVADDDPVNDAAVELADALNLEGATDTTIRGLPILFEADTGTSSMAVPSLSNPLPTVLVGSSVTADSELPAAAAAAENMANPTAPFVLSANMCFDGSTWDRCADTTIADDAVFTVATSRVQPNGLLADESSPDSVDEGDTGAQRMTLDRFGRIANSATAGVGAGTASFFSYDLDETEEDVKTSPGNLYGVAITNTATATRWVRCYNDTAANVVVGTTAAVVVFAVPGNASDDVPYAYRLDPPYTFTVALSCAATTATGASDTGAPGANDITFQAFYK